MVMVTRSRARAMLAGISSALSPINLRSQHSSTSDSTVEGFSNLSPHSPTTIVSAVANLVNSAPLIVTPPRKSTATRDNNILELILSDFSPGDFDDDVDLQLEPSTPVNLVHADQPSRSYCVFSTGDPDSCGPTQ